MVLKQLLNRIMLNRRINRNWQSDWMHRQHKTAGGTLEFSRIFGASPEQGLSLAVRFVVFLSGERLMGTERLAT